MESEPAWLVMANLLATVVILVAQWWLRRNVQDEGRATREVVEQCSVRPPTGTFLIPGTADVDDPGDDSDHPEAHDPAEAPTEEEPWKS